MKGALSDTYTARSSRNKIPSSLSDIPAVWRKKSQAKKRSHTTHVCKDNMFRLTEVPAIWHINSQVKKKIRTNQVPSRLNDIPAIWRECGHIISKKNEMGVEKADRGQLAVQPECTLGLDVVAPSTMPVLRDRVSKALKHGSSASSHINRRQRVV